MSSLNSKNWEPIRVRFKIVSKTYAMNMSPARRPFELFDWNDRKEDDAVWKSDRGIGYMEYLSSITEWRVVCPKYAYLAFVSTSEIKIHAFKTRESG